MSGNMPATLPSDSAPVRAVEAARAATFAATGARFELSRGWSFSWPSAPRRRDGGLLRPLLNAGAWTGRRLLRTARRRFDPGEQRAEGLIDFRERRYMLDYGDYAELCSDDGKWYGRSGRPIATLSPHERADIVTPLWLLEILSGAISATEVGSDVVRGDSCRHFACRVDLGLACHTTPGDLGAPERPRFSDLLALPVEVWIDDAHIRRITFGERADGPSSPVGLIQTIELWDFGADVSEADWTRLPTFRTPQA